MWHLTRPSLQSLQPPPPQLSHLYVPFPLHVGHCIVGGREVAGGWAGSLDWNNERFCREPKAKEWNADARLLSNWGITGRIELGKECGRQEGGGEGRSAAALFPTQHTIPLSYIGLLAMHSAPNLEPRNSEATQPREKARRPVRLRETHIALTLLLLKAEHFEGMPASAKGGRQWPAQARQKPKRRSSNGHCGRESGEMRFRPLWLLRALAASAP
jgi:hypothetical protein